MALFVPGTNASENWILAQMGADLRRAVMDQFGDVLRWGDPYQTFVGNVNGLDYNATGYGVYYPPIAMAAGRAGRRPLPKRAGAPTISMLRSPAETPRWSGSPCTGTGKVPQCATGLPGMDARFVTRWSSML